LYPTLPHTPTVAAAEAATMVTKGTFTATNINLNVTGSAGPAGKKPIFGKYFYSCATFAGAIAALLMGGVWQAEGAILFQNIHGSFPGSIPPNVEIQSLIISFLALLLAEESVFQHDSSFTVVNCQNSEIARTQSYRNQMSPSHEFLITNPNPFHSSFPWSRSMDSQRRRNNCKQHRRIPCR